MSQRNIAVVQLWLYKCNNFKYEIAMSRQCLKLIKIVYNVDIEYARRLLLLLNGFDIIQFSDCFIQRWGPGHFHHRNGHILQL